MHPAEGKVTARGRPQTHLDECGCSPVTCPRSRSSIGRCGPPDLEQGDGLLPHGRSPSTTRRLCAIEVVPVERVLTLFEELSHGSGPNGAGYGCSGTVPPRRAER